MKQTLPRDWPIPLAHPMVMAGFMMAIFRDFVDMHDNPKWLSPEGRERSLRALARRMVTLT